MMKLSDREWKAFVLEDLFKVSGTKTTPLNLLKKNNKKNNKQFPYVTTKSTYNGIDNFFSEYTEDGNVITIDSATDGYVFFQLNKFSASDHVEKLTPKFEINKFIGLFILISIKKATKDKYGYGHKFSQTRIKRQKILLPINNNNPDYDFMEQYIKEKYFNLKSQIKEKQKYEITDWRGLDEVEWMDFQINKLFYNKIGKNIDGNKIDKQNGKVPYVTRKESNNGLDGFIYNDKRIEEKLNISQNPVITIGNETAKPFVQNYDFFTGTKVNILQPIATNNIFSLRFISKMLEQQKKKYSYSFTINSRRLKKQTIKLPTKNNQPDYDFMEQYMKRKENEVLERI
ncbi:restriction endonuclease subunit S [Staphylococcus haemolyticus]|uniref:restriction endonuclease subunit S n=1 Tax=Staphylococcus haemolyticus TaxID=1283 RepID=UPI0011A7F895|nr:restriction endonuclease subunit S [Staphylococcus haemolyticus]MCH4390438.1 restriction endonuclease subunit S [Staphylococcus haemolyticus]